ncbi:MAG: hypothetical protein WA828_15860 [Coleofasciculaceae cyanobacterium]
MYREHCLEGRIKVIFNVLQNPAYPYYAATNYNCIAQLVVVQQIAPNGLVDLTIKPDAVQHWLQLV